MADDIETFCDTWSINGDYHEYAFGSPFDHNGHMWVVLCLTGSFGSDCPWRGWAVRIDESGRMIPTCSGIRSPGGIGFNAAGDVFYTDNQGPWNGTCSLKWLRPGSFQGHPGGNRWFSLTEQGTPPLQRNPKAAVASSQKPTASPNTNHRQSCSRTRKWGRAPAASRVIRRLANSGLSRASCSLATSLTAP